MSGFTAGFQYRVTYSIWNHGNARTKDKQYVKIKGTNGETSEKWCDKNFDVTNQDVLCVFHSEVDIGDYRCVSLRTGGSDGIDLSKVNLGDWYEHLISLIKSRTKM